MNDDQFEETMCMLVRKGFDSTAEQLHARDKAQRQALAEAQARIKALSRHQKELTHLVHGEWLTLREIAEKYEVPVATIRNRYYVQGKQGDELAKPSNGATLDFKGKKVSYHYLRELSGLSYELLFKRYAQGLRDDDLIAPSRRYTPMKEEELAELRAAHAETGIAMNTLRKRWRSGARGAKLREPLHDGKGNLTRGNKRTGGRVPLYDVN